MDPRRTTVDLVDAAGVLGVEAVLRSGAAAAPLALAQVVACSQTAVALCAVSQVPPLQGGAAAVLAVAVVVLAVAVSVRAELRPRAAAAA